MYNRLQLAKKYLHYYFSASNGKGHGIHSPFVFDFVTNILRDKTQYDCFTAIEAAREKLITNTQLIEVQDFGAGSAVIRSDRRVIKDIARSSLKPKKYAQLLYRMVKYYQPKTILEIGTSFGITTAYLASGNPRANVFTLEGAKEVAAIAQNNFNSLGLNNIQLTEGDFTNTLPPLLNKLNGIDLAFIDGNHRKEPSLNYFHQLLNHSKALNGFNASNASTILIFDDIHWSAEMEQAWLAIQQHPAVTISIDLFFIGIVCINHDIKVKQHFTISY